MATTLFIGNKNYSSWSLRPWLCLRWAGIAFEERLIQLAQPGYGKGQIVEVLDVSPGGRVPALKTEDFTVWESLAIAEWAAEQNPSLWPKDPNDRAQARSITSEMHAGFPHLRTDLPMNIHRRSSIAEWSEPTQRDIDRVIALWDQALSSHHAPGPWLYGQRSIADAFYLPVVTRLRSYGIGLPERVSAYSTVALNDTDFLEWESESQPDSWDQSGYPVIDGLHRQPVVKLPRG